MDARIVNMLKGGLTVPFGVFKGKVKGKVPESRRVAKKPECESDLFRRWHDAFRRASGRNARDRAGKVVFGEENFA